jgi:hypothetical protein
VLGLLLAAAIAAPSFPAPPRWPLVAERLMAADAASYAPPDMKRILARRRDRYMAGVSDAYAAENARRSRAEHLAAAARGARAIAQSIRDHHPFENAFYDLGGVVHELASALPPDGEVDAKRLTSTRFLGFTPDPFADPETLAAPVAAASTQAAYDVAVTQATRLFAWIWNRAGGDASIAKKFPQSNGPYVVREGQ